MIIESVWDVIGVLGFCWSWWYTGMVVYRAVNCTLYKIQSEYDGWIFGLFFAALPLFALIILGVLLMFGLLPLPLPLKGIINTNWMISLYCLSGTVGWFLGIADLRRQKIAQRQWDTSLKNAAPPDSDVPNHHQHPK